MWSFSRILGTGLALAFGVLNAMWYELMDQPSGRNADRRASGDPGAPSSPAETTPPRAG